MVRRARGGGTPGVRRFLPAAAVSAALVGAGTADVLQAAQAGPDPPRFPIEIGAMSVEAALKRVQEETGINLVFAPDQVRARATRGAAGHLTAEEAIHRLLDGTGLDLVADGGVVYIVVGPHPAPAPDNGRDGAAARAAPAGTSAARPAETRAVLDEILVPGMRVARGGYEAPTPVTVVGPDQIARLATGNIANLVNVLPAFAGSNTPNQNIQTAAGIAGTNALSLRDLGVQRTLVLLDGVRSVGGTITGAADINTFPQQLVSRIDVVTGGASAAYGSDALAGVVNFVLDKTFTGVKGEVSGGITHYGDNASYRAALSAGRAFAGGRGHALASGEIEYAEGVVRPANRPWNRSNLGLIANPNYAPGNGQPQLLILDPVNNSRAAPGGLITSGPLKGTAFGPGGAPYAFDYGLLNDGANMYGSSQADALNMHATQSLGTRGARENVFLRAAYDVTDEVNVFAQASWGHADSYSIALLPLYSGNLVVRADNAFLPPAVAARAAALGVTAFGFGTINGDLGNRSPEVVNDRTSNRYLVGAQGAFGLFGARWMWDAYLLHGVTRQTSRLQRLIHAARYAAAIDAVRAPDGAVVCRASLAGAADGCVPYNIFGTGVNAPAAIDYVTGTDWRVERFVQTVQAASLRGAPFSTWAGPVSVAAGVERRRESVGGIAEQPGWFLGNYIPSFGGYTVAEGFAETVVPLAADAPWARAATVNAAVRATRYSTAGYVTTWKTGLTYAPVADVRLRATRSRDIRAPNLLELFSGGVSGTNNVYNLVTDDPTAFIRILSRGNLALTPEKANTTAFGVVVEPRVLPGFSASADYWDIDIKDAIGALSYQDIVNLCYKGNQDYCRAIARTVENGVEQVFINTLPTNMSRQSVNGLDVEASYRFGLDTLVRDWRGNVSMRALGTYYFGNYIDNTASPPVDLAGQNVGSSSDSGLPRWRWTASVAYDNGSLTLSLDARGISPGTLSNAFIACTAACPAATVDAPTINLNRIDGATYFDLAVGYSPRAPLDLFLNVQNIMNTDPAAVPRINGTPYGYAQTNPGLYDVLGRVFRAGVRFRM